MALTVISIFSYFLIFTLLTALAYRDVKEYILPNILNIALALSFMSFHIATHWQYIKPPQALEGALAGGGLLLVIRFFANRFYNADSLGLGDVKLMTAAGFGLGIPDIFMALSLGAFAAILHGLVIAHAQKENNHRIKIGQINVPAGLGLTIGIAFVAVYRFGFGPFLHG